jgi:hypothetical protein
VLVRSLGGKKVGSSRNRTISGKHGRILLGPGMANPIQANLCERLAVAVVHQESSPLSLSLSPNCLLAMLILASVPLSPGVPFLICPQLFRMGRNRARAKSSSCS